MSRDIGFALGCLASLNHFAAKAAQSLARRGLERVLRGNKLSGQIRGKTVERDSKPTARGMNGLRWILWWRVDKEELDEQVLEYDTLKIFKSARGISLLLLLFSGLITVAFVYLGGFDPIAFVDAGVLAVLGIFIYLGHRWAMVLAMVLWTIEKALLIVEPLQSGGTNPVMQIIWWAIFMHAFYLAFRVEQERRTRRSSPQIENVFD